MQCDIFIHWSGFGLSPRLEVYQGAALRTVQFVPRH